MTHEYIVKVDVSRLVEQVQSQKLLFYPVMIHMLGKIMSTCPEFGRNKLWPVYQLRRENGALELVWQEMKDDAEAFFADYAAACYESLVENGAKTPPRPPAESFGVFYADDAQTDVFASQAPTFFLYPFVYENGKIILPLAARGNFKTDFLTALASRLAEQIRLL